MSYPQKAGRVRNGNQDMRIVPPFIASCIYECYSELHFILLIEKVEEMVLARSEL